MTDNVPAFKSGLVIQLPNDPADRAAVLQCWADVYAYPQNVWVGMASEEADR